MSQKIFPKHDTNRVAFGLTLDEFRCKCDFDECKATIISPWLIGAWELLRWEVDKMLIVTCGYRCPRHNHEVSGSARSRHLTGEAIDISTIGHDPEKLMRIAKKSGFSFLKYYEEKNFLHMDTRHLNGS